MGPTPISLGGKCTCLHQAAIQGVSLPHLYRKSRMRIMIETDCYSALWICVLVRQFIPHWTANLMKGPFPQQVLKYKEGLNICPNATSAMLPKGRISVFATVCAQVNPRSIITTSTPKHTADKSTVLQHSKSKLPAQVNEADPGRLCSLVVTDTMIIIPMREA